MVRKPLSVLFVLALALTGCTGTASPAPGASGSTGPVDYTAWSAGRSTPVADPIYPALGNPDVDVLHYGLDLSWAPETRTFTGQATLRLRAVRDVSTVSLDLSSAYQLDSATLDGAAATGSVSADRLTVARPLAKDAFATLVVRYHGTPKVVPMPSHRRDVTSLGLAVTPDGSLWTTQEPYGAFTWYPVSDQPSDKALYDIAITVPAGWSGVASGTPDGQDGNTFRYTTTDPVASYLTTLAVGRYQKETATGPHGLPLTYWFLPDTTDAARQLVRKSPEYLTWLEERFGPYPFPTAGVVMVAGSSAMETQQMVTMGRVPAVGGQIPQLELVLLHEYAHHWFGDTVSPKTWQDLWLSEGWATYAQMLREAQSYGTSAANLDSGMRSRDAQARSQWGPPSKPRADSFAVGNAYHPPAMMLRTIHGKIGDTAFFALARDWVREHRNSNQDRASFIAFVNQHTGTDLTVLINDWLDSTTTPL